MKLIQSLVISFALTLGFLPWLNINVLSAEVKNKFNDIDSAFDSKMNALESTYQKKSKELDEKFANILSDEWLNMKFKAAEKLYPKPKPDTIPTAPEQKIKEPDNAAPVSVSLPRIEPSKPVPEEIVSHPPAGDEFNLEFDFLGAPVSMVLPAEIKTIKPVQLNNNSIAEYWKNISSIPHENTLKQLRDYQNLLLKSDWAYLMFLEKMSKSIYPGDLNRQRLYTWFLLTKTGFISKVGYDDKALYLLLPADEMLFGKKYFIFDNEKYFMLSSQNSTESRGSVYTYQENYPGAVKKISLAISEWPRVNKSIKKRDLSFAYNGQKYNLPVQYDEKITEFTETYPQTSIDIYAKAPLSENSQNTLLAEAAGLVDKKSETEAVNILLALVQKAFSYKTDDQQFGREKWLFAEETLNYPYSDCEDRSVIFAFLVKKLLNLEVVFLKYPLHMATAVRFSQPVHGDQIKYGGKIYTICDPTYINATYGNAMPQLKNISPEIVTL